MYSQRQNRGQSEGAESRCTQIYDQAITNSRFINKNGHTSVLAFSSSARRKSVRMKVKTTFKFLQHKVHTLWYTNVIGSRDRFPIPCPLLYNLCFYTSIFLLETKWFVTLFIDIGMWRTCHTTTVCVETINCAQLLALFYWLQYCFVEGLKRETMQKSERKKEQNEAEH